MTTWLLVGILLSPQNEYKDHWIIPDLTYQECTAQKPQDHMFGTDHVVYGCVKQEEA